jgi:sugar lactone lactonase YvrE/fibronectin type 3 domain-containing protein
MIRTAVALIFLLSLSVKAHAAYQVKFVAELPVDKPVHVAPDQNGNIYVTTKDGAVSVQTPEGKSLLNIQGKDPSGDPFLKKPTGIAVYGENIYVCDASLDRVVIFSRNGAYRDSFGEGGSGPKQLSNPDGIFVYQGIIYVADYGNDRIQVFGPNGVFLQSIGTGGGGDSQLKSPTDVAVDHRGNVYVIDGDSRQVKIFRQNGTYSGKIRGPEKPYALAMSDDGIFVTDIENYNITKYSFSGEKLFSFGTLGLGRVQFKEIWGISADSFGKVYAVDREKKTVQIIATDKSGKSDLPFSVAPPTSVRWAKDYRLAVKKIAWDKVYNRLYAVDPENKSIVVMREGQVEKSIKLVDRIPISVAVDSQGFPWIMDKEERQLLKLDADGKIVLKVGSSGSREGYFSKAQDIFIGKDGLIYVADTSNDRVQVFNADGVFLNAFTTGASRLPLESPIAIEQDAKGNLYVLLDSRNTIAILAPNGQVIKEFGGKPPGRGKFESPVSLALAGNELMVLDAGTESVKVFTLQGDFKREFGAKGVGKGDFKKPAWITVLDDTKFLVSDPGNKRIQEFITVYTPAPPSGITAKGGMRSIDLAWKAAEESNVSSFRVFRLQDKESEYKEVATAQTNSFRDTNVLPDIKYSYRVSAIVKGGNENISIESAVAVPQKFTPPAPTKLEAKSQEWSVDLTWQPDLHSYIDHYAVYRVGQKKELPPVFLAKTKDPFFTEVGLESDTRYTYLVSAISIDGVESERVSIDANTIIATKPPLEIDILEMQDIFSNTYKIYENEGIGKIRLTNNTRDEIVTMKLAFTIKEYMDFPTEIEVKNLPPRQSREIVLKAVFNNRILEVTEDTPVQTELKATYFENQKQRSFSKNNTINLYEKHRMMWVNKDRVATFVTSKDPVVLEFTRAVVTQYSDIGSPLVYAAAVYDYLGYMGMTYLQHPNNPYQIVEGKTNFVDYVQYPRETLKRNSGVCTDLVVFFSAVLEGLGIRTMLLGTPDHLFMMFAIGQVSELGDSTMNGMFAIHEGTVWAPIELTLVGSSFMKAWETGSKEYYDWREKKGLEITDLGHAWGRYKPASLPLTDWRAQVVKREEVDKRYSGEIIKLNKIKLKYSSNRYFALINNNPNDGHAYHQLGIIYGESGEMDEARKYLEKAAILLPESAEVTNNLANLQYIKGDYQAARKSYEKAVELDPADPYVLVNLSLCYLKLDNREKAVEAFQKAARKDPSIVKKHRTLAVELLGSM